MAVTDLWHRTLVYFGMADEPDDYAEEYEDDRDRARYERDRDREPRVGPRGPRAHLPRATQRAPPGPAPPRYEFDDIFADETRTSSRPVMRSVESRPQPAEVHLIVPKSFNDAQQIADKFKGTIPVILNLQSAETDLAKRLIDFSSGLTYALDGGMQRVADKVFMLTPRNVEVSAEERARLLEKGFFNQY